MKTQLIRSILTLITIILIKGSFAQNAGLVIIENIPESNAWELIHQSFSEHDIR